MTKVTFFQTIVFAVLTTCFVANASAQTATFQDFLKQFPSVSLPYVVQAQDLQSHLEQRMSNAPIAKAKRLPWEYYEFLPDLEENARASRMPVYPEPIARFETETYHAVLYNTGRSLARQYKTYNIAVFSKDGKYIASRCIGGVNPTALAAISISADLQVTISEYKIQWKNDITENGFDNNSIIGLAPMSVRTVDATTSIREGEQWNFEPTAIQPQPAMNTTLTAEAK
jgi:hypothetical protein